MKYENCLKEELVKYCYTSDKTIEALEKQLEEVSENEEINKDILLKNIDLERQLKRVENSLMFSEQEIINLKQQLGIYEKCIEALSENRKI